MFNFAWYQTLNKPPLAPPGWIFSPMWTFLYLTMLISLILYIRKPSSQRKTWGFVLFFTQLLVNLAWTPAFFGIRNMELALALLILLDILVLFNIIEFSKISKSSSRILIPYLVWILFATYLNIGYIILN